MLLIAFALAFCSFQEIECELEHIPRDSLLVFHIDETLICPQDTLLRRCFVPFWNQWFREQQEFCFSLDEIDCLMQRAWERAHFIPYDCRVAKFFKKCSRRGIRTIGFSECGIQNLVFDRLCHLKLGFRPTLDCIFPNFGWFCNGVLFCGSPFKPSHFSSFAPLQKAELLGLFLDQMPWSCRHVVCIFSCRETMAALEKVMKRRGIGFKGFLFEAPRIELDERIALFQLETLCRHQRWISDCEAAEFLNRFP